MPVDPATVGIHADLSGINLSSQLSHDPTHRRGHRPAVR